LSEILTVSARLESNPSQFVKHPFESVLDITIALFAQLEWFLALHRLPLFKTPPRALREKETEKNLPAMDRARPKELVPWWESSNNSSSS
jgi:hypothetical protein